MVRTLIGVKIRIVRNSVHGSTYRKVATTLSYLGSAGISLYSADRLVVRAQGGGHTSTESIVITLTTLFGLWVFGPLLVGGVDDALDPTRLTMLPITRREMHRGMFAGALIGPLPVASMIILIGAAAAYAHGKGTPGVAAAAVVMLLLIIGASRSLSVALAFATRTRRGKDVAMLLASLGAALLFLVTQSLRFLGEDQRTLILRILRWLPAGQIAHAMLEFRGGALALPVMRVLGMAAFAALLLHAWVTGIDRLLVDSESVRHSRNVKESDGLLVVHSWLRRWIDVPVAVMVAKELRYLARSPQRRSSMIVSIVIGTVFALLQSMRYNSANALSVFGAPIAMLFGVHATNNLLGTDAASLWMEQTTGTRLRDQLIARGIAATPNLFIPDNSRGRSARGYDRRLSRIRARCHHRGDLHGYSSRRWKRHQRGRSVHPTRFVEPPLQPAGRDRPGGPREHPGLRRHCVAHGPVRPCRFGRQFWLRSPEHSDDRARPRALERLFDARVACWHRPGPAPHLGPRGRSPGNHRRSPSSHLRWVCRPPVAGLR